MILKLKPLSELRKIDTFIHEVQAAIVRDQVKRLRIAEFQYKPFSIKQKQVLTWWRAGSPVRQKDGIIADGAIRSGKSVSMSLSFGVWAMTTFNNQNFLMCGKTIGSFRRNVVFDWKRQMRAHGYKVVDSRSDNLLTVSKGDTVNRFYLFGGKDERSQDLVQGITAAGVLIDEVALVPESFVNQATSRCSVEGSKFWFNCNPQGAGHWFKKNWIDRIRGVTPGAIFDEDHPEKNLLYLHFTMDDNLSLSEETKARYKTNYPGVFFLRYVLGLWVNPEGRIYPDYRRAMVSTEDRKYEQFQVSIDYGTHNPFSMGLWGLCGGVWYRIKEYYHSGRETNTQMTDDEYYAELEKLVTIEETVAKHDGRRPIGAEELRTVDLPIKKVIIDPSAASFIALIRRKGRFHVVPADNSVLDGIRNVASAIQQGLIKINDCCIYSVREFEVYAWDEKATSDTPIKDNDHAMDDIRYFVYTNKLTLPRRRSLLR